MSVTKLVIEPHTRVEGHLRVEVSLEKGVVVDTKVCGTMWRGIEYILNGKTPKEAISMVQRICGVCPVAHAIASARAVENAYGWKISPLHQKVRNLLIIFSTIHDHLVHFYFLSLPDWIDFTVLQSLSENELKNLCNIYGKDLNYGGDLFKALNFYLKGPIGFPFLPKTIRPHPDLHSDREIALSFLIHQLFALHIQRNVNRLIELFGGSYPHIVSIFPGGGRFPSIGKQSHESAFLLIEEAKPLLNNISQFLNNIYLQDLFTLCDLYPHWLVLGQSYKNFLVVPELPSEVENCKPYHPGGIIVDGELVSKDLSSQYLGEKLLEDFTHGWYAKSLCRAIQPDSMDSKYTYVPAPRFMNKPFEVGSSACLSLWKAISVSSHSPIHRIVELVPKLNQYISNLLPSSVLGRHLSRALKLIYYADLANKELQHLKTLLEKGGLTKEGVTYERIPAGEYEGIGLTEAPRGALYHRVLLKDGTIKNYQVITPSGWNMSPRDERGVMGPCEKALIGIEVRDPEFPLEIYRVIRSFDPCMACAVHCVESGISR